MSWSPTRLLKKSNVILGYIIDVESPDGRVALALLYLALAKLSPELRVLQSRTLTLRSEFRDGQPRFPGGGIPQETRLPPG